jgi:hypothetical protein
MPAIGPYIQITKKTIEALEFIACELPDGKGTHNQVIRFLIRQHWKHNRELLKGSTPL